MKEEKMFFKKCPDCDIISGFVLPNEAKDKNEEYICGSCGKENNLSKWSGSTHKSYNKQQL
jgi:hypothetical protein